METFALIPLTIASLMASYSDPQAPVETAVIATHSSPEIAGLWELDKVESEQLSEALLDSFKTRLDQHTLPDNPAESSSEQSMSSVMQEILSQTENGGEDYDALGANTLTIEESTNLIIKNKSPYTPKSDVSAAATQSCKERYNFAADNEVIVTSGGEWSYGHYVYRYLDDDSLPMIAMRTVYENNKMDCSGNQIDQAGEAMFAFVRYMPEKNRMHWCVNKEGTECFMSLRKLLP